mmetsp:Transcript_50281/g.151372  ORF Transcript_50281/g.151372 Transcript_50281/m.151372 type:complete len:241 (-) Transcript_50281:281-1003(-)
MKTIIWFLTCPHTFLHCGPITVVHLRICIISNCIEVTFDLLFIKRPKFTPFPLHHCHFNLGSSEITPENVTKAHDSLPNGLVRCVLRHIFHSFLQKVGSLLLLCPARRALKRKVVARAIDFEHLRPLLVVHAYQQAHGRQGSHRGTLGVHLRNVRDALRQRRDRDGIPVLKLKVGRLVPRPLNLGLTVSEHSRAEAPDLRRDVPDVRDGLRIHEAVGDLLLRDDGGGVFAANSNSRQAGG